jgi:type I restriction enzyme, R subunit
MILPFFQAVRAKISKIGLPSVRSDAEIETAVRQRVSKAVVSEGIHDILAEAGVKKPDISILSDKCLAEMQGLPQRNLAREALERLLR